MNAAVLTSDLFSADNNNNNNGGGGDNNNNNNNNNGGGDNNNNNSEIFLLPHDDAVHASVGAGRSVASAVGRAIYAVGLYIFASTLNPTSLLACHQGSYQNPLIARAKIGMSPDMMMHPSGIPSVSL